VSLPGRRTDATTAGRRPGRFGTREGGGRYCERPDGEGEPELAPASPGLVVLLSDEPVELPDEPALLGGEPPVMPEPLGGLEEPDVPLGDGEVDGEELLPEAPGEAAVPGVVAAGGLLLVAPVEPGAVEEPDPAAPELEGVDEELLAGGLAPLLPEEPLLPLLSPQAARASVPKATPAIKNSFRMYSSPEPTGCPKLYPLERSMRSIRFGQRAPTRNHSLRFWGDYVT
jgi:hypothetical protein